MDIAKYAYLAGIIDGEGHFQASAKSHGQGLRVSVIDEPLISWLHETFPGTNRYLGGRTVAGNQVYVWFAEKQTIVRELLLGVMPYLVIKRKQAEAMLELIEHLRTRAPWVVPTTHVSQVERERRRDHRIAHTERTKELRQAVVEARRSGVHD